MCSPQEHEKHDRDLHEKLDAAEQRRQSEIYERLLAAAAQQKAISS